MALPVKASFPCPHCWLVYYSKSTITRHVREEHWDQDGIETTEQNHKVVKG